MNTGNTSRKGRINMSPIQYQRRYSDTVTGEPECDISAYTLEITGETQQSFGTDLEQRIQVFL